MRPLTFPADSRGGRRFKRVPSVWTGLTVTLAERLSSHTLVLNVLFHMKKSNIELSRWEQSSKLNTLNSWVFFWCWPAEMHWVAAMRWLFALMYNWRVFLINWTVSVWLTIVLNKITLHLHFSYTTKFDSIELDWINLKASQLSPRQDTNTSWQRIETVSAMAVTTRI